MLRKPMWFVILGLGLLSITLAPFVLPSYHLYLACLVMINVIMALGLNVLTGNSGQISLCHSSFMAMGAYLFTILNNSMHWNIVWCGLLAVSAAGLGGWIVGYPARRLAGIYLALATLAFLALTQTAIEEFPDLTGGIRGLKFEHSVVLGISTHDPRLIFYTVALSCAACLYSIHCLMNFPLGRAWDAIRTSPQAAMALGVPVARTKLIAFTLSAAYAGWAGVLFAWVVGFIDPIEFGVGSSLKYITFIVVGGVGSILGSLLGSVSLTLLPEFLRGVKEYSDLVYAVLLLGALMFMPKGLAGWVNGFLTKSKSGAAE